MQYISKNGRRSTVTSPMESIVIKERWLSRKTPKRGKSKNNKTHAIILTVEDELAGPRIQNGGRSQAASASTSGVHENSVSAQHQRSTPLMPGTKRAHKSKAVHRMDSTPRAIPIVHSKKARLPQINSKLHSNSIHNGGHERKANADMDEKPNADRCTPPAARPDNKKAASTHHPQTPPPKKYITVYPCSPNHAAFPAFRIPHFHTGIRRLSMSRRNENKTMLTLYTGSARSPGPLRYRCVISTSSGRTTAAERRSEADVGCEGRKEVKGLPTP
ncbi:hypothetical protein B0H13DRAFT_1865251 [Mycena leptocephala]|nr:hypothetical protein B0H13DRAFT_1865251 [Mycena leptocephala]